MINLIGRDGRFYDGDPHVGKTAFVLREQFVQDFADAKRSFAAVLPFFRPLLEPLCYTVFHDNIPPFNVRFYSTLEYTTVKGRRFMVRRCAESATEANG